MYLQSFLEENKLFDPNEHDENTKDIAMLYPRSFVDKISKISQSKIYDYNFIGTLFFTGTFKNRRWILDFIKNKFNKKSYLILTDASQNVNPKRYKNILESKLLGEFDKTHEHNKNNTYIPIPANCKTYDDYIFFDNNYFSVMCQSNFTLCPAGDAPWSMRFFEAIMCKSIPILESHEHTGRNSFEKSLGYKYYLKTDEHIFRQEWVEENYKKFILFQTLTNGQY